MLEVVEIGVQLVGYILAFDLILWRKESTEMIHFKIDGSASGFCNCGL